MKKIVLVCMVVLMAIGANAQVYVGGTLGISSVKTDKSTYDVKTTTFKIMPEVGYELDENWSIGTVVGYEYNKTGDVKINTLNIAPYARYSFLNSDLVRLFVDGGFGFSTSKVKGSDALNSWNVGLKPGLAIKLSDHFCLIAKYGFFGYKNSEIDNDGASVKQFGLNLDTDELSFGFHYIF
ncbi:porin family protein [Phocaeicola sp.]